MIGGLTIAGTFLWPSGIPDLAELMVSGFWDLSVPAVPASPSIRGTSGAVPAETLTDSPPDWAVELASPLNWFGWNLPRYATH
jgi:hypothetical protein